MDTPLKIERDRVLHEYERRRRVIKRDRYAPWSPAIQFLNFSRLRAAALLLRKVQRFPAEGSRCLDLGCGSLGWLGDLLNWGMSLRDLHGIDLSIERIATAHRRLPEVDLVVGDAALLPWRDHTFRLVIASTVFSSVIDLSVRRRIAGEIMRVLTPGGTVIIYDFLYDNPRNPNVKRITRDGLRALFPGFNATMKRVTLAPPLLFRIAPKSWFVATLLETLPFLRTHILAIMLKPDATEG